MKKDIILERISVLSKTNKIYIVGHGNYGRIIGKWLRKNNIVIEGYVDVNKADNNFAYDYSFTDNSYFLISSEVHKNSMIKELRNVGIDDRRIIDIAKQELVISMGEEIEEWTCILKKNEIFKKKHINQKCFIIGNGPSLNISDLEKIRGFTTFGCNSIFALYGYTDWRPNYYCAFDPVFCKNEMNTCKEIEKKFGDSDAIFTSIFNGVFSYRELIPNLYFLKNINWFLKKSDNAPFSENVIEELYVSGSVTYIMLQLAVYMGFKEIYLLGMDFSYSVERDRNGVIKKNNVSNHNMLLKNSSIDSENYKVFGYTYIADVDIQLAEFLSAKKYADSHGIKIYNATRGGKLEVFERVDFDSLF